MSREIKFRAFEIDSEEMFLPNTDNNNEYFFSGFNEGHLKVATSLYSNNADYVLMQYTGLKDKNGVEIFESDILRVWTEDEYVPNRDSGGGIIDYDREEGFSQVGVVGFTGCSFDYKTAKTLDGRHEEIHAPIDWIENYEVIGNVYEHSSLLKEDADESN